MHLTDESLNEYLDEALDAQARAQAESHLASCPECAARLDSLRALFAALDGLPEAPLARDLSTSVVARLPKSTPALQPAFNWLIVAQAVVAVVLLAIAAPIVLASLAPVGISPLSQPISQFTADLLAGLQAQWQGLLNTFTQLSTQGFAAARALTVPLTQASTVLLGAIAGALALLWLVGNGVLLRSTFTSRSH